MFNNLLKRLSKNVEKPSESVVQPAPEVIHKVTELKLTIKDGELLIDFDLAKYNKESELIDIIKDAGLMLNAVTDGSLNSHIIDVLAEKLDFNVATAVVKSWGNFKTLSESSEDDPVVRPSEVLKEM